MPDVDPEPTEEIDEAEAKKSDEDVEEETEEVSKESVRDLYDTERTDVDRTTALLREIFNRINPSADMRANVDRVDAVYDTANIKDGGYARPYTPPPYGYTPPDEYSSKRIDDLRAEAKQYREEEVGTQNRKGRLAARASSLSLLLGISTTVASMASLVFEAFFAARPSSGPPPDDGLTADQRAVLVAAVESWRDLDDAAMWQAVANFTDSWNPSWQAQILMMDTVKKLSRPLDKPWIWRGGDAVAYVLALVAAYRSFSAPPPGQNRARALYVAVAPMKYDRMNDGNPVPLPRQVAADLVELAITDIVLRPARQKQTNERGAA